LVARCGKAGGNAYVFPLKPHFQLDGPWRFWILYIFVYTSFQRGRTGEALLAMHVEDYEFATSVLNRSGFKLMYEEDLVR